MTLIQRYEIKGINPEPWAIGPVTGYGKAGGRKVAPNPKVVNYERAVREALEQMGAGMNLDTLWPKDVTFYYVRSTADGGQPADVTNLNKATEDACQGILYGNDRNNRRVMGDILEQGPDVKHPGIIVVVQDYWIDPTIKEQLIESLVSDTPVAFAGSDYTIPEDDPFE